MPLSYCGPHTIGAVFLFSRQNMRFFGDSWDLEDRRCGLKRLRVLRSQPILYEARASRKKLAKVLYYWYYGLVAEEKILLAANKTRSRFCNRDRMSSTSEPHEYVALLLQVSRGVLIAPFEVSYTLTFRVVLYCIVLLLAHFLCSSKNRIIPARFKYCTGMICQSYAWR